VSDKSLDVTSFDANLRGVLLPIGLRLDTVELRGQGLHIEGKPFSLSASKPGDMVVMVSQEALAAYLNQLSPGGLRNFQVSIVGGKLFIQASKTLLIEVRATAACRLRIQDGRQLYVELDSVDVLGGGGLTNLVRSQLDSINPILDASDLPIEATLTEVEADAGRVVLRGKVAPRA
jgi:hypothetical protein